MTLALAGAATPALASRRSNLKFIWDVVSQIKVGERGRAYVVDAQGRLIAHPDISLVLRNTDLSHLAQVQAARASFSGGPAEIVQVAKDIQGQQGADRLCAGRAARLAGVRRAANRRGLRAALRNNPALGLAPAGRSWPGLSCRAVPGAKDGRPDPGVARRRGRIGGGDLAQRISITTGDELEELADQFNDMARRLQESYADLEGKVESRTRELAQSVRSFVRSARSARQ